MPACAAHWAEPEQAAGNIGGKQHSRMGIAEIIVCAWRLRPYERLHAACVGRPGVFLSDCADFPATHRRSTPASWHQAK
jgi:hypothetical protein